MEVSMGNAHSDAPPPGYEYVFVRWFRHRVTKKIIYPKKGRVFRLLVKSK
jgi:hypothetical protein